MRIALTGVAGTIGGAVARRLAQEGHELVLIDQRPADSSLPGTHLVCDGRERSKIEPAIRGCEMVCHIGEIPNVNTAPFTPAQVKQTNLDLCRTMLDSAVAVGARRLIYTSSCQVYGYWGGPFPTEHLPTVWPIDERQPPSPRNAYAESKVLNEEQCARASRETRLETIRFRFPWVLGPRQAEGARRRWETADHQLVEGFWTYLDLRDAVEAYVCALAAEHPFSGDDRSTAFHFVADRVAGSDPLRTKLARFLPNFPPLPDEWPDDQPPVSIEKAEQHVGWRPRHRFDPSGALVAG